MRILEFLRDISPKVVCPCCKLILSASSFRTLSQIYSGGPFYCNGCKSDVTEQIYGETKSKPNEKS